MAVANLLTLNNGHHIPTVGLGVYLTPPGDETYNAVRSGLKLGYRHIDTAQFYRNEADVGRAVRDSGIPREEVFVTTKLFKDSYGYDSGMEAIRRSLAALQLGYLDLLLLHSPGPDPAARAETWRAMEEVVKQGLVRSIGVSNFSEGHLEKLAQTATHIPVPAVNQIEVHPYLQRRQLVEYCKSKGIVVEAYSPLAKAKKLSDPRVTSIAERLRVSPAQVLLRWSLQSGLVPLPKSVQPARQAANLDLFGFELSTQDMEALGGLEEGMVTGWDPVVTDPV